MDNELILLISLIFIEASIPVALVINDKLKVKRFRDSIKPGDYCSTDHGNGKIEEIKGDTLIVKTWNGKHIYPRNKVYP